jgi:hypothetical protein
VILSFIPSNLCASTCATSGLTCKYKSTTLAHSVNATGNAILVSLSYPINFYGLYPISHIAAIALNTWGYKMIIATLLFPIAILAANSIKQIEKLDYFDYGVS